MDFANISRNYDSLKYEISHYYYYKTLITIIMILVIVLQAKKLRPQKKWVSHRTTSLRLGQR